MELFYFNPIFSAFMTFGFLFGFKTSFQDRLVSFFLGYSDKWIEYRTNTRKEKIKDIIENFKSTVEYGNGIENKEDLILGFETESKSVGETVEEHYKKVGEKFSALTQTDNFAGISFFIALFCMTVLFASGYTRNCSATSEHKSLFFETLFMYQCIISLIVLTVFILDCGIIKKTWLNPTKIIFIYSLITVLLIGHLIFSIDSKYTVKDTCIQITPLVASAPFLLYSIKVLLGASIIRIYNRFSKKNVDEAIHNLEDIAAQYQQANQDKQKIEERLIALTSSSTSDKRGNDKK